MRSYALAILVTGIGLVSSVAFAADRETAQPCPASRGSLYVTKEPPMSLAAQAMIEATPFVRTLAASSGCFTNVGQPNALQTALSQQNAVPPWAGGPATQMPAAPQSDWVMLVHPGPGAQSDAEIMEAMNSSNAKRVTRGQILGGLTVSRKSRVDVEIILAPATDPSKTITGHGFSEKSKSGFASTDGKMPREAMEEATTRAFNDLMSKMQATVASR